MPLISFDKQSLPFLLDGAGQCAVNTGDVLPDSPIPSDAPALFSATFQGDTPAGATLGRADTVKVGVSAKASATLTPLFPTTPAETLTRLSAFGLDRFLTGPEAQTRALLCLEVNAGTDTAASSSFRYGFLKASVTLAAGADGGVVYVRPFDPAQPLRVVLPEFFAHLRLPDQVDASPEPGEAFVLQYGGYLRLGAEASAGYRLTGTKAIALNQIALSETYGLSIVGRIGMTANVAGRFSIVVTSGDRDGWARVRVSRHRSADTRIAPDVNVGFRNDLDLPANGREFLGALLGVNAKSYLAVFDKALELSDFATFEKAVDGLAKKYVEAAIGASFDTLATKKAFTSFLGTIRRIVSSYDTVEDRAVTLFDRYFDRLEQIVPFLERLDTLTPDGLASLRGALSPELWTVLSQLTDGDPLGYLLGRTTVDNTPIDTVPILRTRARQLLDLVSSDAHADIRRVIGVAKHQFGLDVLIGELSKVDTVDELKARSNDVVGDFVRRLVGRTLDSSTDLKDAFAEVRDTLQKIDGFSERVFAAFKDATNSAYTLALHTEYSRARESDALVDVQINVSDPRGRALLVQCARGDFDQALTIGNPDVVRLAEGVFTHRTTRTSAFNVNVLGWHLDYRYEGIDRVITETGQRLVPSDQGITVYTSASLELDRLRKRTRERESIHVNFLFQALGQSAGVIPVAGHTGEYVIEALSSFNARYQLAFTDESTSVSELADYLAFARDFGLDAYGATQADLAPLLPVAADGTLGPIDTSYDIRFTADSLKALVSLKGLSRMSELRLRRRMRLMLLANYLKTRELLDVAFAYATDGVYTLYKSEGTAQFPARAQRTFLVSVNAEIDAPAQVTLDRIELERLTTLFNIEEAFIAATRRLLQVLGGASSKPSDVEKVLAAFGSTMKDFDDFDQASSRDGVGTSTVFALFHELVRLADPAAQRYVAILRLSSRIGTAPVEKIFLTDGAVRQQR
ncbi:MAG: hypothetical protein QM736_05205 [Vicinamibacterales bacterium]